MEKSIRSYDDAPLPLPTISYLLCQKCQTSIAIEQISLKKPEYLVSFICQNNHPEKNLFLFFLVEDNSKYKQNK